MKIAIAGVGYVGVVTGACLAEKGHCVCLYDPDIKKINKLLQGISIIHERSLDELLENNKERLHYTNDFEEAYKKADAIFIAAGTPEKEDGSADLQYVYICATQIAQTIQNDCVVFIKSTVPPGANDQLEQLMRSILRKRERQHIRVEIVSNPEFLSQGTAVQDTLHASRIVIGAEAEYAYDVAKEIYKAFDAPIVLTNRRSAEMIKYASNDFLALKISYINEIANLCELMGADITDVARGMGLDERIGNKFLEAGIGYGGSCFPKDTKALDSLARINGYEIKTVRAAIDVNEIQKLKPISMAKKYYRSFKNLTIALLGLAFKPGTDDLREAPSLKCIPVLLEDGANIKAWDPICQENYKKIYPDLDYCRTIEQALEGADLCMIFTQWPEIKNFDLSKYKTYMKSPIIIDGRNCYALNNIMGMGLTYASVGRQNIEEFELFETDEAG